jgi:hypothetical protein
MSNLAATQDFRMRRVFIFAFVAMISVAVTSARSMEASCDLSRCMSICRSANESDCTGMCGRIISLCRRLVAGQGMPSRGAKRPHRNDIHEDKQIKFDARARSLQTDMN